METRRQWRARNSRTGGLLIRLLRFVVAVFLLFLVVDTFLIASVRVGSRSMEPTLAEGDLLLVSPLVFGPKLEGLGVSAPGIRSPARGDMVVVRPPFASRRSFLASAAHSIVSFFTARRVSLFSGDEESPWIVKRVIAVPGDTVRIERFRAAVRPQGETTFRSEEGAPVEGGSTADADYRIEAAPLPEPWSDDLPFSGSIDDITLGPDEYFLLGDNRPISLDSRHFGPVSADAFLSLVVLRYWPISRFGRP